jgi:hypothetical protein
MTRDGFLIIRNQYADGSGLGQVQVGQAGQPNNDDIPLSDSDNRPRLRRVDEIMFFAKGQFTSLREPLHPHQIARADAAAIYYGHGERRMNPDLGFGGTTSFRTPQLDDNSSFGGNEGSEGNARLGLQVAGNPNRYASDWTLTRRVTLLRPPSTGTNGWQPGDRFEGTSIAAAAGVPARWRDNDVQIGLQPAANSVFRSLQSIAFAGYPLPAVRTEPQAVNPRLSSGMVDLATTDLSEIRLIVMTTDRFPGDPVIGTSFYNPAANSPMTPDGAHTGVDGVYRMAGNAPQQDPQIIGRMQAWMSDALPAWSDAAQPDHNTRVRCEPAATDYVGIADPASTTYIDETGGAASQVQRALRRADQMMLSSSNFLPHCTEFIVEWSFGHTFPSYPNAIPNYVASRAGETVWYGMPRMVNGQKVADTYLVTQGDQHQMGQPFPWNQAENQKYERVDGALANWPVDWRLIHGPNFSPTPPVGQPIDSYFGYVDPTFNPEQGGNNNGLLDLPNESRYPTIPWAWPKLIRVTLSLADPNDPSVEQTFQFVFEVPQSQQP